MIQHRGTLAAIASELVADEREVLLSNIARARATLDWMETAVSTGQVHMDEELARILRGE
ncbi:hypothetical protein SGFS_003680 [Streptomyces graminofaciens]|uniref:Antitoxin n=1 Tax=Streptomyces graminofaciens TaxID=68212 RepID=A0ABN5V6Z3_9ACTN|nr:hypothetical protein SGFS_003680 [Streptomyces graminofaciens]